MSLRNVLILPFRIRAFFEPEQLVCISDRWVREDEVLMLDKDGHVHTFKWLGRLIDQPAPVLGDDE